MREECGDPGAVDEVACTSEGGAENEVEENAVGVISDHSREDAQRQLGYSHLRVKDASICFHNTNGLVESLESEWGSFTIRDYGREVESQVLRVEFGNEVVANAVSLTRRNFHVVPRSRQIANDLRTSLRIESSSPEIAANKADANGLLLVIGDSEKCLGLIAIDELDAEDL